MQPMQRRGPALFRLAQAGGVFIGNPRAAHGFVTRLHEGAGHFAEHQGVHGTALKLRHHEG